MQTILDLLEEYSRVGKQVDIRFLKNAIDEVIKEEELRYFVKKTEVYYHSSSQKLIEYNPYDRQIVLNSAHLPDFKNFKIETDPQLLVNAYLLQQIFQVLELVKQQKTMLQETDSFEGKLLRLCHYDICEYYKQNFISRELIKKFELYTDSELFVSLRRKEQLDGQFSNIPSKRMANISAIWSVHKLLLGMSENKGVKEIFESSLNEACLSDYDTAKGTLSPTEQYLNVMKQSRIANIMTYLDSSFEQSLHAMNQESLDLRIYLGLPITEEERVQLQGIETQFGGATMSSTEQYLHTMMQSEMFQSMETSKEKNPYTKKI